jgi:hypothetical protein
VYYATAPCKCLLAVYFDAPSQWPEKPAMHLNLEGTTFGSALENRQTEARWRVSWQKKMLVSSQFDVTSTTVPIKIN